MRFFRKKPVAIRELISEGRIIGPKEPFEIKDIELADLIITGAKQAGGQIEVRIDDKPCAKLDGSVAPVNFCHSFGDKFKIQNLTVKSPTITATVFVTHYKEKI